MLPILHKAWNWTVESKKPRNFVQPLCCVVYLQCRKRCFCLDFLCKLIQTLVWRTCMVGKLETRSQLQHLDNPWWFSKVAQDLWFQKLHHELVCLRLHVASIVPYRAFHQLLQLHRLPSATSFTASFEDFMPFIVAFEDSHHFVASSVRLVDCSSFITSFVGY